MKKSVVIKQLSKIKSRLAQYGVSQLGLFGSTVREENLADSDIDILIDFHEGQSTFVNYMSVCEILEELFSQSKLDIVTMKGLSPYIGKQILSEVEYV